MLTRRQIRNQIFSFFEINKELFLMIQRQSSIRHICMNRASKPMFADILENQRPSQLILQKKQSQDRAPPAHSPKCGDGKSQCSKGSKCLFEQHSSKKMKNRAQKSRKSAPRGNIADTSSRQKKKRARVHLKKMTATLVLMTRTELCDYWHPPH